MPARETVDIDHGLGKGLGGFLRQIVPNAARDIPVLILALEFLDVRAITRPGSDILNPQAGRLWNCKLLTQLAGDPM